MVLKSKKNLLNISGLKAGEKGKKRAFALDAISHNVPGRLVQCRLPCDDFLLKKNSNIKNKLSFYIFPLHCTNLELCEVAMGWAKRFFCLFSIGLFIAKSSKYLQSYFLGWNWFTAFCNASMPVSRYFSVVSACLCPAKYCTFLKLFPWDNFSLITLWRMVMEVSFLVKFFL